jgi:hypothetical protein
MRKYIKNNDGIALVTSLLLTMISLVIVMAVMYMITQSVQRSGMYSRYKTALEASYGGTDIIMKEIVPEILKIYNDPALKTLIEAQFNPSIGLVLTSDAACFQSKLVDDTKQWIIKCAPESLSLNPKSATDLTFRLQAINGSPYTVYSKVVDTITGNTDRSGLQLEGAGVAESQSVLNPTPIPYIYRLEIQAERSTNAIEQGNMSVVYAD